MRFAMFQGEKSVTDLANRLFRIQDPGSQAAISQTADALLKANPQLKDVGKIPVGSLIAIPDSAPAVAPEEEAISVGLVRSFAAQNVQTTFDSLQKRLVDIEAATVDNVKSATDRMQTPEMKKALKTAAEQNLGFVDQLPSLDSIAKETNEILKGMQTARKARKQALAQLQAALTSFAKK